ELALARAAVAIVLVAVVALLALGEDAIAADDGAGAGGGVDGAGAGASQAACGELVVAAGFAAEVLPVAFLSVIDHAVAAAGGLAVVAAGVGRQIAVVRTVVADLSVLVV